MDMEKVIKEQAEKIGRELTENERKAIEGIYTLTNALWSKQDQKVNRLQVMSWLEGLTWEDWHEYHSDSEVSNIATAALELLKEQEAKQGKWERQYSRPGVFANLFWWCSVCGQPTRYNDAGIFYQYCPRCGAKLEPCKET